MSSPITFRLSIPRSSMILTAMRRFSPGSKGRDIAAPIRLDQLLRRSQLLRFLAKTRPAVVAARHGEEHLPRIQAAAVVVRVQHPHGYLVLAARLHVATLGVVVVEPLVHSLGTCPMSLPFGDCSEPERRADR